MAHKHIPRVFAPIQLISGSTVVIPEHAAHKLVHVLRCGPGSALRLFNGLQGEFECTLTAARTPAAVIGHKTRQTVPTTSMVGPVLMLPLLRHKESLQYAVEKGTECGAGCFLPYAAQRAQGHTGTEPTARTTGVKAKLGLFSAWHQDVQCTYISALERSGVLPSSLAPLSHGERMHQWAVEATEQCGSVHVPPILGPLPSFAQMLKLWCNDDGQVLPKQRHLLVCDEAEVGSAAQAQQVHSARLVSVVRAILQAAAQRAHIPFFGVAIGPEGGWSALERAAFDEHFAATAREPQAQAQVHRVSLGPRILRAETAVVAALTELNAALELDGVR